MAIINSNSILFIDNTDNRKLNVYITSNLPTTQIFDPNNKKYSPNWSETNLNLSIDVYLQSNKIENDNTNLSVKWFEKIGSGSANQISTSKNLVISSNKMTSDITSITYICEVEYQKIKDRNQITFLRVDSGTNGANGTSITLKGVAYAKTTPNTGNIVTLYVDEACTTELNTSGLTSGTSYMVDGFLCVYDETKGFVCTGQIQGPRGEDAKDISLSASAQAFKVDKTGVVSPETITVTAHTYNTVIDANSWKYSTDGGNTFLSFTTGVTQNGNNQIIVTGANLVANSITIKVEDGAYSDVFTIYKVLDGADGASGVDGTSASTAFLTNENITFVADLNGQIAETTFYSNVVGYSGTNKVAPIVGDIEGLPDGMILSNKETVGDEVMLTFVVSDGATLGSEQSNNGTINIPIISPVSTILKLNWSKINTGASGVDSITFQLYAPDGYLLEKDTPYLTLKTFAYDGSKPIISGVTYIWSKQENNEWFDIDGQTGTELIVTKEDVLKAKTYQCAMEYKGNTYYATATVQDKNDVYNAAICVYSNACSTDGQYYWILYTLVYSENEEIDPLLGTVSQVAPDSPLTNDYWYKVDVNNSIITLMQYDGTTWVASSDTQNLHYNWSIIGDNGKGTPLNGTSKVRIITSRDFTSTSTFVCQVNSTTDGMLAQSNISLTDVSDPIMSADAPLNPKNGQVWIKPNNNGSFLLFVWDADNKTWVMADADTRNKVYTSRPSSYSEGDLWITSSNEDHGSYLQGTLLQAHTDNTAYNADDWSPSLKYDKDIEEVQTQLNDLHQYITMSSEGLRIRAKTESGDVSPYNSLFTSTKLAFCDGDVELLTIGKNDDNLDEPSRVIAPEIEVKNDLMVGESFSLGNLKLIIESNGSFSFTVER